MFRITSLLYRCRRVLPLTAALTLIVAFAMQPTLPVEAAYTIFPGAGPITIGNTTAASPYPATINVFGLVGHISDVAVSLNTVTHTNPDDLDIMLVSPQGTPVILMSDACGTGDVNGSTWAFYSGGDGVWQMPDNGPCASGQYVPVNHAPSPELWLEPVPPAPYGSMLQDFDGENPNGLWNLFVVDDNNMAHTGSIASWTLSINTTPVAALLPASGTQGVAGPYPLTYNVAGQSGQILDLNVTLSGLTHSNPADLDILLIAPSGNAAVLMSDRCGAWPLSGTTIIFDDEAAHPVGLVMPCGNGNYKPANSDTGPDSWPAPAAGGYSGSLDTFDGENPNGTWRLFIVDDAANGFGHLNNNFSLNITTGISTIVIPAVVAGSPANPYPATVNVGGVPGSVVADLNVTVSGLAHSSMEDIEMVLVAPTGQRAVLMSDVCQGTHLGEASFIFDDEAPGTLPANSANCTGGTYRPTDYLPGDALPAPAPVGAYVPSLSVFDGINPAGAWSLYIADNDGSSGFGYVTTAWTMGITYASPGTNPPAYTNLITNGDFANGLNDWGFWGVSQQVNGGVLQLARQNGTPDGGFYQFIAHPASIGAPFELTMNLGNSSATPKTLNLVVRNSDWSDTRNCFFNLPANAPMQTYRMRFKTSANWSPIVLQGWLTGDTLQSVQVDNLNLQYKPVLVVGNTECTVTPPAETNLIANGDFSAGTNGWGAFNAAMQVVPIASNNVMEMARWNNTPNGGFFQFLPWSVPANGVLRLNFQLANPSAANQIINIQLRHPDWAEARSCFYNLPPNAPTNNYQMQVRTSVTWPNIVLQGWAQAGTYTGTPPMHFRFDNFSLQYLPNSTLAVLLECAPAMVMSEDGSSLPEALVEPGAAAVEAAPPAVEETKPEGAAPAMPTPFIEQPTAEVAPVAVPTIDAAPLIEQLPPVVEEGK